MDARDQLKVIKAGFIIISALEKKVKDINVPVISYKSKETPEWGILEEFDTYSKRNIRMKQLLHQELIIKD